MAELFSKDRKLWTKAEQQQAEYFFRCNEFFSKFYQQHYFQDIVELTYYAKVTPERTLHLTDNKRPAAIILLRGNIAVYKRQSFNSERKRHKKQTKLEQYRKVGEFLRFNETLILSSECKVVSLHESEAEILFVPAPLYNKFSHKTRQEKDQAIFNLLSKMFSKSEPKHLMELAKSGCKIKELRINNYIYQHGSKPESVFIILEGSAKIERPGYSQRNSDVVVVSTQSLLGEKDLCLPERQSSAICCSALIRLLEIPKEGFLKFAKTNIPDLKMSESRESSISPQKLRKQSERRFDSAKLPMIMRFRSGKKSEQEQERQYKLIRNSHILLDAVKPSKHRIRSKSSFAQYPKDILEERMKLYKKIRPIESRVDLTNRII